ncbi:MAG: hypothetical protein ACTS27_04335 [Phycisphaerales bacterium]
MRLKCAALSSAAVLLAPATLADSLFVPLPTDYESSLKRLVDLSMRTTHGPTSGEGDGMLRYEHGLYPPDQAELDLPELRSASPLAALQWSNRWRELIVAAFGGTREMSEYWESGDTTSGAPLFSVLSIGDELLQSDGRRRTIVNERLVSEAQPTVGRALTFASGGGGSSGGGGGGGGSSSGGQADVGEQTPSPIVQPDSLPPAPTTNNPGGSAPPSTPAPTEPVVDPDRVFVLNINEVEWVNPAFNQSPPPPMPDGREPGDDSGASVAIAIPTPTAVGLGAAGLLACGARMRRRGLI